MGDARIRRYFFFSIFFSSLTKDPRSSDAVRSCLSTISTPRAIIYLIFITTYNY